MTTTGTPQTHADAIRAEARAHNIRVSAHDGIVTAVAIFAPGDARAYAEAERSCLRVLSMVRQTRPGSVWGSTSDGVGGHVAIEQGVCVLSKSGADKRVARILAK